MFLFMFCFRICGLAFCTMLQDSISGPCQHGSLEDREKSWIEKEVHKYLHFSYGHTSLILILSLLKGYSGLLFYVTCVPFRKKIYDIFYWMCGSTAELEPFNNHILMSASKHFCFSPPVYEAQILLAGVNYNHHVHRPLKRRPDGSVQYIIRFNRCEDVVEAGRDQ